MKRLLFMMLIPLVLLSGCASTLGDKYNSAFIVEAHGKYDYYYVRTYKFTNEDDFTKGWLIGYDVNGNIVMEIPVNQVIRITGK